MSSWNVVFQSEFGTDNTFTAVVEGKDEQDVLQKAGQEYCNATVESVSRIYGEGFDIRSLYDNLKDVPVDVEEKSKQNYLDARGLFGSKLREMLSTEDFLRLNLLMERQDRLVDRLFVAHVPSILEWTDHGTARYKSFSNFILSEYELKSLVNDTPCNEVEQQLIPVVNEICSIFDSVKELKEISLAKIAKPFMQRAKKAIKKKLKPSFESKTAVEAVPVKANLYICEDCTKTFRSDQSACPACGKSADLIVQEDKQDELVITGQEELAKDVEVDCGGEIKDTGKEQGKVEEQTEPTRTVIAKGVTDKTEADRIASSKGGVVVSDEEDPKKFMVLVKEAKKVTEGVPEDHQKRIALKTLKMSDAGARIMGGMTKEEARAFLKKIGFSDTRIAKLEESKKVNEGLWKLYQLDVEDLVQAQKLQKDLEKFGLHDNELMSEIADAIKRKEQDVDDRVKENKKNVNEASDEETYTLETELDFFVSSAGGKEQKFDVETPKDVSVTYRIDLEHRSWGIKNVDVFVTKPIDINYTLVEWGDEEDTRIEKRIVINPEDITYEWDSGASTFAPQNVNITVTPDGKVTDAVVTFSYWTP